MSDNKTLLKKAVEDFLTDRDLNNHSQKTIKTYEQRLRYFKYKSLPGSLEEA